MISVPRIAPHYHVEVVDPETVVLLCESDHVLVKGQLLAAVAAAIDGVRSAEELVAMLGEQASQAEVYYALEWLERQGCITDAMVGDDAAWWTVQHLDPRGAAARLAASPISLACLGRIDGSGLRAALESCGVQLAERGELTLVAVDDYLRPELRSFDERARQDDTPWMLVKPTGHWVWIGPVFVPRRTGCWLCLARRLRANRPVHTVLEQRRGRAQPLAMPRTAGAVQERLAQGLIANHVARWIVARDAARLDGRMLTLDLASGRSEEHVLVLSPHCPACGVSPPADRVPPPIRIESRRKLCHDGGYRTVSPEEMLSRHEHHVSKISGVVRNLERRPALDGSGVFVFAAGYNPVMLPGCDDLLRSTFRTRCAGKGTSEAQARASALGEAIERYCGQFQGNEPRRRASFRSLGALARDPNHWMGYSRRQYEMRHEWNRRRSRFTFVPVPLPEDAEIEWTPVYSLNRREHGYLPTSCCYLSYVQPEAEHHGVGCSNGNAAGSTLEEAILQGFLEVVERDAVAIWWYNQVRRPAVDLDAFAHPVLSRVVAFLRERGRDLWVLDVTSDLGIPVFAAISRSTRGPEAITLGFGAHLDPTVALLRAVTEQAQTLAALLPDRGAPGVRLDFIDDPATLDWLTAATLARQGYLVPETDARPRGPRDFEDRASGDLREDILYCQALVERLGMELLVLDQTRPEIGLPVVKVFVPGMRHFWARFAPGRLYDVPVQLGWLHEPRKEVDLNPVAMFL